VDRPGTYAWGLQASKALAIRFRPANRTEVQGHQPEKARTYRQYWLLDFTAIGQRSDSHPWRDRKIFRSCSNFRRRGFL
jgi:hypothetical protein